MKEATSKKTDLLSRKSFAKSERFWVNNWGDVQHRVVWKHALKTSLIFLAINLIDCMGIFRIDQLSRQRKFL